jgi:hypothetical protein
MKMAKIECAGPREAEEKTDRLLRDQPDLVVELWVAGKFLGFVSNEAKKGVRR